MSRPEEASSWGRVRAEFEHALGLEPDARASHLVRLGESDTELRRRVEQLLAADERADDFLEPLVPESAQIGLEGRDVGGFRILRVLAEGGMGTVYEAEQTHPRRRVALKTMRFGLTSPQSTRRFQYEGELLAKLRHPNIAQVLGAGVLELEGQPGLPWLALELVEGARPLSALGRDASATLPDKLRLFLMACQAVHHAHLRGVLHRDVKGANVLVDGDGHVKVIDFGIARALGEDAVDVTRSGEVVGTLASMSPEQLGHDKREVDARTDVYALGILLYELVVGAAPFDFKDVGLGVAARTIETVDPVPPTQRAPALPRELDWIVARATAKRADERYGSVSELAADVRRLLADEPVQAGPPSTIYRLRKYYRRHRLTVMGFVAALLALVGGLVGTSIGLVRAQDAAAEAREAEQAANDAADVARAAEEDARIEALLAGRLLEFFQEGLAAPDPEQRGRELTMLEFLERTAALVDERFESQPLVAGLLHRTIGRSYYGLGESERATHHLERAAVRLGEVADERERDQARRETARARSDAVLAAVSVGDLDAAQAALDEAAALFEELGMLDEARQADLDMRRGRILIERGAFDEAELVLRAALEIMPADNEESLATQTALGGALQRAGRDAEAIAVYEQALEAMGESQAPVRLALLNNLAMAFQAVGRTGEAIELLEVVLPKKEAVYGTRHPDVQGTRSNLAALYYLNGRGAEALPLWRASLDVLVTEVEDEHPVLQTLRVNVAVAEIDHGDPSGAVPLLDNVIAVRTRQYGEDDQRTLLSRYELGRALQLVGETERALEIAEDIAARIASAYGESHATLPLAEYLIAQCLAELGREEDALGLYELLFEDLTAGRRNGTNMPLSDLREAIRSMQDELGR